MSLLATYMTYEAESEKINQRLAEMRNDPELIKEVEFRDKVQELMREFNQSASEVVRMLDPQGELTGHGGAKKTRKPRSLKVYKNPHTNEVIETRGGNHNGLKAWKAQYGADIVEDWVQEIIPQ